MTTTASGSSGDLDALDSLDLRTPLASFADSQDRPSETTPIWEQSAPACVVPGAGTTIGGSGSGTGASGLSSPLADMGAYSTDASLPYGLTWAGMAAGTSVVISGGAYGVNTDDLDGFAATLNNAADWLEDARDLALASLEQVRCSNSPFSFNVADYVQPTGGFSHTADGATIWDPTLGAASGPTVMGGIACYGVLLPGAAERATAITALEALTGGIGSLDDAVGSLRALADDVTLSAAAYTDAESGATGLWPLEAALQLTRGYSAVEGGYTGRTITILTAALSVLSLGGAMLPDGMDDMLQGAETILGDSDLADWVIADLTFIMALAIWAQRAETGAEAAMVETYLARVATELDPAISAKLPQEVQVGSRTVETSSLTPMQRVAYYLAVKSEQSGAFRYGEPTGVTVTPHGGQPVTVPPGVHDPFGLGTAVPVIAAAGMLPSSYANVPPPGTAAEVIRYSHFMKSQDQDTSSGVVSILRTDHADGTTSWLVVVPGTTDWGSGNSNPQDLLTNLQAVAGRPTEMETAVVTAMREAGIAPGDKVGLYGHSQGAITASNIAADPAINEQFHITNLLTAGGPTAHAALPDNVNALHIENTGDAVPALDAAPTPRTATRTVVTVDTHASGIDGYPHGALAYATAVDGMSGDPMIDQWTEELAGLTGAGESGADTTEIVFDVTRDTPVTGWERVGAHIGKTGVQGGKQG
ncbi:hypothetical protein [Actinomyces sp. MRS3W]|uniref:hypothetical protein n=1 Tax=Actinomyces sp. MRS3W TaxID=2800796 RepID=UPI0028FD09F4|nr:hypothetical protein [Actinomyces sp. MRS3W]MDU0347359.1 hypothetical protein [Actinomyces sp. MRS3W]